LTNRPVEKYMNRVETLPASIAGFEAAARDALSDTVFDATFGAPGIGKGASVANAAAFQALRLRPRVLRGNAERDTATTVLGQSVALPLMLAPLGSQRRAHPDGEIAAARAATAASIVMVVSIFADFPLEEVRAAAGIAPWFQIYMPRDREIARVLVERAAAAGYQAIVLTVDMVVARSSERRPLSLSVADDPNAYPNFAWLPAERRPTPVSVPDLLDPSPSWADVEWLRSVSPLPLVLKGIQTAEDAALCRDHGVDAVVVSNHGGHSLASARPTLEALPEVVDATRGLEVFVDGGVRSGVDILKALALGARAVLIGRLLYWGLATGGQEGLAKVLTLLARELETAIGACGLTSVQEASPALIQTPTPVSLAR
jgi:4-hydroxymandelate oxidase